MGRADTVLDSYIMAAEVELKRLYDARYVTYREVRGALRNAGLEEHLDDWIYENLK